MPPSSVPDRGPALAAFLELFDGGAFFEAHEILEPFWVAYRGDDREFYRGLIQAAVALHHVSVGNAFGATGVAARARRNLVPYSPRYDDVDVDRILARLAVA